MLVTWCLSIEARGRSASEMEVAKDGWNSREFTHQFVHEYSYCGVSYTQKASDCNASYMS